VHGERGGARDLVSIADVGFGVSQCLPVVVALIAAQPGQLVYLEQPEIHLHPRAQRRLAHVIKRAAEKGVTAIVETHSALLLKEIQTLVAKGELDKDIVKLHWFQRQEDGRTKITSADLDENGAFGPWPEDFDEVELDAEKDYLDAVESRELHS
jgi:predicted ATPase